MSEERLMVLKMLKEGTVTVEEAEALLEALSEEGAPVAENTGTEVASRPAEAPQPDRPAQPAQPSQPAHAAAAAHPVESSEPGDSERMGSLGEEIGEKVRRALHGARPGHWVGESVRESMRDVSRSLREELRGMGADRASLGAMVRDLFGLASASDEVTLSHSGEGITGLTIRNRRGDVKVVRSPDRMVRVTARRQVWWHNESTAESWLPHVQVTLTPQGSDLLLEVDAAARTGRHLRYRVDLTVQVPEGVGVDLDLKSGDVRIDDLAADLAARMKSGDLSVGAHRGRIRAEIRSGDVSLQEAEELELHVTSGDVDVKQVRGAAQVRVTSGDVALDEVRGPVDLVGQSGDLRLGIRGSAGVRARTVSGDIAVTLAALAPGAQVALEAVAGDLSVTMAQSIQAGVRARATAGAIRMPDTLLRDVQQGRGWVEGVIGSRDATIDMRAISGNLTLRVESASHGG